MEGMEGTKRGAQSTREAHGTTPPHAMTSMSSVLEAGSH